MEADKANRVKMRAVGGRDGERQRGALWVAAGCPPRASAGRSRSDGGAASGPRAPVGATVGRGLSRVLSDMVCASPASPEKTLEVYLYCVFRLFVIVFKYFYFNMWARNLKNLYETRSFCSVLALSWLLILERGRVCLDCLVSSHSQ